jgi:Tfp pilus assembly protein PilF
MVGERPDFVMAWVGLGELALERSDRATLAEVLGRLEQLPQAGAEAAVLRARGHLARREFAAARARLEAAIAGAPQALGPRVLLSHALLQEGRDLAAAERALRDILVLDPEHAEARHNLTLLLQQQGRTNGTPREESEMALSKER